MTGFNYEFDANQYTPEQGGLNNHPEGKFPAVIINTSIVPIKDDAEGRPQFVVEFETPAGTIKKYYGLWSPKQETADNSHKRLAALSHATGIFRASMMNEGAAFRGARCMIEVTKQKDSDFMQVNKVFDANGNEPGKAPQQPPANSAGFAPQAHQAPPPAQQPPPAAQGGPWAALAGQPPTTQWNQPPTQQPPANQPPPQEPPAAAAPWQQQPPAGRAPWQK
jgi:hypothetical protein